MSAAPTGEPGKIPGKWWVSPYDFDPKIREGWKLPKKVILHDVTLRDGEQTPGVVFRKAEKLKIAHALAEMGVQRIEGGMVAVSPEDAEAIAQMAKEIKTSEIASFLRTRDDDIDLAIKCNVDWGIIETPVNDARINAIWGGPDKAAEELTRLMSRAKAHGLKTCLFMMESTRARLEVIKKIAQAAEAAKADSVCVVDTRGVALPQVMGFLVSQVKSWVNLPVEVHDHNYWGLATATTLAAVEAGAEVAHTCVNGLGGNAALDETIMTIQAMLGIDMPDIKTEKLFALSNLVRELSNVDWYKPFLGRLNGVHEPGIGIKIMWENKEQPGYGRAQDLAFELIGKKSGVVVLGKKSGRFSAMIKSWEQGWAIPSEEQASQMLVKIKKLSEDKKRWLTDEEFKVIYNDVMKTRVEVARITVP
ncbi:MAG: 2-isopropylmalate synthase [Chloroflexi bacterium]|nr:2-isopropylmalate synthase [Chloroflexota bacterium]